MLAFAVFGSRKSIIFSDCSFTGVASNLDPAFSNDDREWPKHYQGSDKMAAFPKRFFRGSAQTKRRKTGFRNRRFRSEQLEPKLLLTRLFAINTGDQDIHELDPANGDILATFEVPSGPNGHALGYDGIDLWYANEDTLFRLDPDTADVRQQWTLPNNVFRDGLAVVNGRVYMQESSVFETYDIFDPGTGSIVGTVDMENTNDLNAIPNFVLEGMSGYNGMLLVTGTDQETEEVLFLEPDTGQILSRFTVDMDFTPSGLAVIGDEVHIGSSGDAVHVHNIGGSFLRTYSLPITFDEVHALGGDGVDFDLNKYGNNDFGQTSPGIPTTFTSTQILGNDEIPGFNANDWEILSVTQPATGTATINANGDIEFDPQSLQGITTFEYTAGQKLKELESSQASISDWFGRAVDIENGTAVVGAPLEDTGDTNAGAAYVLEQDINGNWVEVAVLVPDDPDRHAQFGTAVAISRDTIAVGAWLDDDSGGNSGEVYIYDRDGNGSWSQTTKLTGSDTTAGDHFGKTVAIHGDTLVAGAEQDDPVGSASGAAYVFQRDELGAWSEAKKLVASDAAAIDRFGGDVSIYQHTIVVGAYRANPLGGGRNGAAYVFERDQGGAENWGETQRLLPSTSATNDQFGYSVAVHGKQIAIGAPLVEFQGPPFRSNAGAVFIFDRDAGGVWNETGKVYADDPGAGDRMGSSVAIENGTILAGSPYADGNFVNMGAAYAFQQDQTGGYVQVRKLVDPAGRTNDRLGTEVALYQTKAIVGVPIGDGTTNNTGTAHVVDLVMASATIEVTVTSEAAVATPPKVLLQQAQDAPRTTVPDRTYAHVHWRNQQRRNRQLNNERVEIELMDHALAFEDFVANHRIT